MPRITPAGAFSALLLLAAAAPAAAVDSPYLATKYAAKCDLEPSGELTCRYRVGKDLEFFLHRVGEKDVQLRTLRNSKQGDFTIEPQLMDRCVLVKHGRDGIVAGGGEHDYGIVSGRNGMVYQSMRACRLSR